MEFLQFLFSPVINFFAVGSELGTPLQILGIFALSLLIGSFLNVVILRYPIMMFREWKLDAESINDHLPNHSALDNLDQPYNLVTPHSHCPKCHAPVKAWQNIPLLSYVFLRGQCGSCGAKIGLRYPTVELVTALASALLVYHVDWGWPLVGLLILTWGLVTLTVIDIDHQLLPDGFTLALLWLGLLFNSQGVFTDLQDAFYGAVAGYMSLWSVYWLFKLTTGKEGMGFGDFKLLAALGAWLGLKAIPMIIVMSSVVGAVMGIIMILALGRDKQLPIPFGPYLAVAGYIIALYGDSIWAWYLG